jgi:alanyl aminopeptidase
MWIVFGTLLSPMVMAQTAPKQPVEAVADIADISIDGNLRLDRSVVPTHYTLNLSIDPTLEKFSGQVAIAVEITAETRLVRLHGQDMNFRQVSVEVPGEKRAARIVAGKNGGLALLAEPSLPVGPATIHLAYEAPFSSVPVGLYRVEERGEWYAFTQFEPLDARRAFPGFDQPEFKTPYTVTLRVPTGSLGLSNGPQREQAADGEWQIFSFAQTKPLPTYLVAFAVGPFDIVAAPEQTIANVPTRIIATKDKGRLASFALQRTPPIVDWLSTYFGQPYPFAKLDQIGVPNFSAGAMENVGLVTYRERLLLLDETRAPVWDKLWSQVVIAHELAHMWYGNLVTMPWWDDLWLNEAFATWMSWKVIADIDPALEFPLEVLGRIQGVMNLDSKRDARAIRQPILHGGDIHNAFDGITYGKGAAVLQMLEAWIGATDFRDGVRTYMKDHAYGSGATADLLAALGQASGKPVAETIRLFLDQPGTPLVDVTLSCDQDQKKPASLQLQQRRYRPTGSDAPEGQPWTVPVCVRYGFGTQKTSYRECFVLHSKQQEVALSQPGCPVWLHPNADERGYYRWRLQPELLNTIINQKRQELSLIERVALSGQLLALLQADSLSVPSYAEALSQLAQEQHRKVIDEVTGGLWYLHHTAVDGELIEPFSVYTRRLLSVHLERIGVEPQPNETVAARLLRPSLISALATMGNEDVIFERAKSVAQKFLKEPDSVSPETLGMFLPIAAQNGDEALWTQLVALVPQASSPAVRSILVRSLASFEDPSLLRRSFDAVLDGTLRTQDYRTLAGSVRRVVRPTAWQWLTEHYDQLVQKLGTKTALGLPRMAGSFCSQEQLAEVKEFFAEHKGVPEGTERNLNLALEDIERCVRQREAIREPLKAYLKESASVGFS